MSKDYKPTWQGGYWEQENPKYPTPPPVVIPKIVPVVENMVEPLSKKAKLSFATLLTLIFSLVCMAVVFGLRDYQSKDLGNLPNIFDFGQTIIIPNIEDTSEYSPPSIRKANWDEDVTLAVTAPQGEILSPQEIYKKNLASIVFIEAEGNTKISTGTGVIMTSDGYVITNAHVISDAVKATVTLWNDMSYDARLVGYDFAQDLAVLKIEEKDLTPAEFGDSALLQVGEPSYAMGNPLGANYRSTFTDGMVSAVDRVLTVDGNNLVLVQTTAAINSGNSGGALLNQYGQVVGITTIKIMSEQDTIEGMGFAIPTKRVKQIVDCLIAKEAVATGAIGITVVSVTVPVRGLLVLELSYEKSAVAQAGMEEGDVIIEANGVNIYTTEDLNLVKCYLLAGDTIDYVLYRNGTEIYLSAPLEIF